MLGCSDVHVRLFTVVFVQVLSVVPACEIKNKLLRDVIKNLAKEHGGLNDSGLDDDLFAGVGKNWFWDVLGGVSMCCLNIYLGSA